VTLGVANFLTKTALLVLSLIWGFQSAGLVLCDPDSCFLIAVGSSIIEHRQLPLATSFTWFLTDKTPYIAYQWLAEVIMAQLHQVFPATGLIYLAAVLISLSFLCLPLLIGNWLAIPAWFLCPFIFLAFTTASLHLPLRPELFSYLALSLLISWEIWRLKNPKQSPIHLASGCFYFLLFLAWANIHSAFVLGLLFLSFIALAALPRKTGKEKAASLFPLTLSLAGSLCNAYGLRLFTYLPSLLTLRSNALNAEQMPLKAYELFSFDCLPFTLLSLSFLITWPLALKKLYFQQTQTKLSLNPNFLGFTLALGLLGFLLLLATFGCRRLLPFASLIELYSVLIAYCALTNNSTQSTFTEGRQTKLPEKHEIDQRTGLFQTFEKKYLRRYGFVLTCFLGFLLGTQNCQKIIRPTLPQSTLSFPVPSQALDFIATNLPREKRLFNDAQFGDLLLLRFGGTIKVSMDTRFDLYGDEKVLQYWRTANALPNYQEFLVSNKIDWLFFPPRAPIIGRLRKEPGWHLVYEDPAAVILVHTKK
jgi:hypothetical protein